MVNRESLNTVARAFHESRVLLTAIELDVFTAIGDGSNAAEVAACRQIAARADREAAQRAGGL